MTRLALDYRGGVRHHPLRPGGLPSIAAPGEKAGHAQGGPAEEHLPTARSWSTAERRRRPGRHTARLHSKEPATGSGRPGILL